MNDWGRQLPIRPGQPTRREWVTTGVIVALALVGVFTLLAMLPGAH